MLQPEDDRVTAGTFDCLVYHVKTAAGETRFHFAKLLPGPPILMTRYANDKQVFAMTLIRHRDGTEKELLAQMGMRKKTVSQRTVGPQNAAKADSDRRQDST